MKPKLLLNELAVHGIQAFASSTCISLSGPTHRLSTDFIQQLHIHKQELLELLRGGEAVAERYAIQNEHLANELDCQLPFLRTQPLSRLHKSVESEKADACGDADSQIQPTDTSAAENPNAESDQVTALLAATTERVNAVLSPHCNSLREPHWRRLKDYEQVIDEASERGDVSALDTATAAYERVAYEIADEIDPAPLGLKTFAPGQYAKPGIDVSKPIWKEKTS